MNKLIVIVFVVPVILMIALGVVVYILFSYFLESSIFFTKQLLLSHFLVGFIFIYLTAVFFKYKEEIKNVFDNLFSEAISPYSLSIFRIGFFALLNGMYWYQYQNAGILLNIDFEKIPLPYTEWYMHLMPFNYSFYSITYYIATIVAILSAVGIYYRYIAWLNIIFSFYIIGLPMFLGKLFYMQIWFWGSCFLAFSPASDTLSIDYLIKKNKKKTINYSPHYKYGIALKWLWLHLGIIYFFSAIWKLIDTGLAWALGENMINQMQVEWLTNYYTIPAFRLDNYPLIAKAGGLYILIVELLFIFLLLSKKLRWVAFFCGLSIHWGASYFLHLSMGDLQFMYLSLFTVLTSNNKLQQHNIKIDYTVSAIKKTMFIGIIFFTLNSICGLFNISSWPFSAYPSHSSNIKDTFTRIEFETAKLSRFDLDSIAKKNKFRKDNYDNLSNTAINNYYSGDSIAMKKNISILWSNWQLNNQELISIKKPKVYILETPVSPDKKHHVIKKVQIYF